MAEASRLKVATDLSIARHGPSGSLRWAVGLTRAIQQRDDVDVRPWYGPVRRRWRGPLRRLVNAAQDRIFYESLLPTAAKRWGADVLLMPVNLTARRTRIPQVVSILDVNFLVEPDTYDPWFRAYATRMFTRAARDADVVTTISCHSRSQIGAALGIDPERIEVTYPGLDPPPARRGASPLPGPYALFVGATEPHKNIGLLLDAWSSAKAPAVPLVIAGRPGRAHGDLAERAARLGGRVRLIGAVTQRELEAYYAGATVFVFPSLTEGFGYPPLEAMLRGVPVVSSSATALPEVLGDAALYHEAHDVDALLRHVHALLGDRDLQQRHRDAGRRRAARYTWQATAERMVQLLRSATEVGT